MNKALTMEYIDLSKLKCHYIWLNFINFDKSERSDKENQRLEHLKLDVESFSSDTELAIMSSSLIMNQTLLQAMCLALTGDFKGAEHYFKVAKSYLKDWEHEKDQFIGYKYAILSNQVYYYQKRNKLEKAKRLYSQVEYLAEIISKDNKAKAAFLALRGHVQDQLKDYETRLSIFKSVVLLNPTNDVWLHFLHTSHRKIRREINRFDPPSDEEIDACMKALEIGKEAAIHMLSYANLLSESALALLRTGKSNKITNSKSIREIQYEIVSTLRRAKELEPNIRTIHLRLAEALTYNNLFKKERTKDNEAEAEKLILHCLKTWPTASEAFHKAGKFYELIKFDKVNAEKCYRQGVTLGFDNFPCLMSLLKFLSSEQGIKSIIEILDNSLELYEKNKFCRPKLLFLKGLILWREGNHLEAVDNFCKGLEYEFSKPTFLDQVKCKTGFNILCREDFKIMNQYVNEKFSKETDEGKRKILREMSSLITNGILNRGNVRPASDSPPPLIPQKKYSDFNQHLIKYDQRIEKVHEIDQNWRVKTTNINPFYTLAPATAPAPRNGYNNNKGNKYSSSDCANWRNGCKPLNFCK